MDMAMVRRMALFRHVTATLRKNYLVSHLSQSLSVCVFKRKKIRKKTNMFLYACTERWCLDMKFSGKHVFVGLLGFLEFIKIC